MSPAATSDQNMPVFAHQVAALLAKQRREDLELIGATLRRRGFKVDIEKRSAAVGQTTVARSKLIDFHAASPILRRDRQGGGIRVPHFSMKPIVRMVPPARGGQSLAGSKAGMTAGEHFDYVSGGARIELIGHLDYIRRQFGQWDLQRDCLIDMLDEPIIRANLNEQAYWSNIEGDVGRHRSLFEAAEAAEVKPKTYSLVASTADVDALSRAARREDTPDWFRQAATRLAEERERARQRAVKAGKTFRDIKAAITTVSSEAAFEQLTWTASQPDIAKLIGYEQGRSGRFQTRFVLELPCGIGARKRTIILRRFCQSLADEGWMVAGAIHLAEQTNDRRNDHIHVDAYDRPARWLDNHQCWDFAYISRVNGKDTHPHRQDKVRYDKPPAKLLRDRYIQIVNEVVDGQQDVPVFVTGTYAENDIELTPLDHMGSRASALEKQGIRTDVGSRNAARIFADDIDACQRAGEIAERNLERRIGPLFALVSHDLDAANALDEYDRIEREIIRRKTDASVAAVLSEMVRSRAETVLQTLNPTPGYRPKAHAKNEELRKAAEEHLCWVDKTVPSTEEQEAEQSELCDLSRRSAKLFQIVQQAVDPSACRERIRSFIYYRPRSKDGQPPAKATQFDDQVKGRLLQWLAQHERDPDRLIFEGNQVSLSQSMPISIGTFMRRFIVDQDVQDRLFEEMDRRALIASFAAGQSSNIAAASEIKANFGSARAKPDVQAPESLAKVNVPRLEAIAPPSDRLEAEIRASLERRAEPARSGFVAVEQPRTLPERAVSREEPAEVIVEPIVVVPSPPGPSPSERHVSDPNIPPATRKTDHADRPDYAAALRDVRRGFAAREPDRRATDLEGSTQPLSELRRLSSLGLVRGVDGPEMLLHGLSSAQLGHAAGPVVGAGDGLRRTRGSDRGIEQATGDAGLSVDSTKSIANNQGASSPSQRCISLRPTRAIDIAREAARKRPKPAQSTEGQPEAKRGNYADADIKVPANHPLEPLTQVDPLPPPDAAVQQPPFVRPKSSRPPRPRDPEAGIDSPEPPMDAEAHRSLLAKLSKLTLPLREVTQSDGGRERISVILDGDLAVSEDADLIKQAIAQQHLAQYQQQLRRQFDVFLAGVRDTLMAAPATTPENWRAVLNPKKNARLGAAIAAAEGSPSFQALIPTNEPDPAEGLRRWIDAQRGRGPGE